MSKFRTFIDRLDEANGQPQQQDDGRPQDNVGADPWGMEGKPKQGQILMNALQRINDMAANTLSSVQRNQGQPTEYGMQLSNGEIWIPNSIIGRGGRRFGLSQVDLEALERNDVQAITKSRQNFPDKDGQLVPTDGYTIHTGNLAQAYKNAQRQRKREEYYGGMGDRFRKDAWQGFKNIVGTFRQGYGTKLPQVSTAYRDTYR